MIIERYPGTWVRSVHGGCTDVSTEPFQGPDNNADWTALVNTEHSVYLDLSQHIRAGMEAHWASNSVFPSQSPHFARTAVAQLENELL